MNTSIRFPLLALVPLALGACSAHTSPSTTSQEHSSTEFTTDKLHPSMSAQSDGQYLTVFGAVLADGAGLVKVDGTDWLTASLDGGPDLVLDWQNDDPPHYTVKAVAPSKAVDAVVTLHRANGEVAHVNLHVPGAFDLTGTLPTDVKRDDLVTVHVSPAPDPTDTWFVYLDGTCANYGGNPPLWVVQPSGDALSFTAALDPHVATGASCSATVKVQRVTYGSADATFGSTLPTDLLGVQERRFVVTFKS